MNKKISNQIIAKIKSEKISPREKWIFLIKNYGIWVLAILGIVLVGVFVGNTIHEIAMKEWDIMHRFPGGRLCFALHVLPLLWLFGIASAFVFAFFIIRKTKHGYRHGVLALSGAILVVSSVAGVVLLSTPLPPKFRQFRMNHFIENFDAREWMNPEEGFLFGEILEVKDKFFVLNSVDNSVWEVDVSEAKIPLRLQLTQGIKVRVIGKNLGDNKFSADFVKAGDWKVKIGKYKVESVAQNNFRRAFVIRRHSRMSSYVRKITSFFRIW
jgi:hypothetical protein